MSSAVTVTPSSGTGSAATSVSPLSQVYRRRECGSTSHTCGTPQDLYSSSFSRTFVKRSSGERISTATNGGESGMLAGLDVQKMAKSGNRYKPIPHFIPKAGQAEIGKSLS